MHILTKITLGLGGLMLLGSIIAIAVGFGTSDIDGEEVYSGTSPTTWNSNLVWTSTYYIYVEEGSGIQVELLEEDDLNYFIDCEDSGDCFLWDDRADYDYIGELYIIDDGEYNVRFTGNGDVMVIETEDTGFMAAGAGCFGICCAILVLGLGLIFVFALKDPAAANIHYQPGVIGGTQVVGVHGAQQAPVMYADGSVTGVAQPAVPQQQEGQYAQTYDPNQQPPGGGF